MLDEKENINIEDLNINPDDEESILINVHKQPLEIIREYAMNTWYENIKEHTFPSFEIDLGVKEIDCILSHHRSNFTVRINHHLSDVEKETLKQLEVRIDEILQNMDGGAGFVKLSTRSPKDAVFERSHPVVERYLNEVIANNIENREDNNLLIILTQACNNAMKIRSGKEASALLCNSDRVADDLKKAKETYLSNPDDPLPKLIVRAWVDIPLEHEFRGYVCKRQLNGLSQYFHYCHFPKLAEEKDQIQTRILEYFETVKDLITHDNYVIDFGILMDGTIKIIEINPFHYGTGAPFFGWKKGSEGRNIILNGPFTFRIRTEPLAEARQRYMAACWDKFLTAKVPKTKGKPPTKATTNTSPNTNPSGKKNDDCIIQ
jgi:hypothetical protein